jgi:hypothetical protein
MDALNDHTPRLDTDAEHARLLREYRAIQARRDSWVEYSYWQIALAGSLTGVVIVAVGTIIGLALIRALH